MIDVTLHTGGTWGSPTVSHRVHDKSDMKKEAFACFAFGTGGNSFTLFITDVSYLRQIADAATKAAEELQAAIDMRQAAKEAERERLHAETDAELKPADEPILPL